MLFGLTFISLSILIIRFLGVIFEEEKLQFKTYVVVIASIVFSVTFLIHIYNLFCIIIK
ncbi:hypothetical protein JOC62_003379 [Clostridium sardiniense]|nr:hypothetical protein [Clostridium sardiniense]